MLSQARRVPCRRKMTTPLERDKPYVFGFYWASNYVDAAQTCDLYYSIGGDLIYFYISTNTAPLPRYEYRYVEFQGTLGSRSNDLSNIRISIECNYISVPAGQSSINFYFDDLIIREDISIPEGCPTTPPVQDPNPGTPSPPDPPNPPPELLVNPGMEDANTGQYAWRGSPDVAVYSSYGVQNAHTGTKFL